MNTLSEKIRTIFLTCHYFNIRIIICSKPERIHIQVSKHWISNAIDTHFIRGLFCLTPVTRSQCARGHVLIVKLSQFLEKSLNVKTCGRCNVTKYHYLCMLFFLILTIVEQKPVPSDRTWLYIDGRSPKTRRGWRLFWIKGGDSK